MSLTAPILGLKANANVFAMYEENAILKEFLVSSPKLDSKYSEDQPISLDDLIDDLIDTRVTK